MTKMPDFGTRSEECCLKIVFQNPDYAVSISEDTSVLMGEIEHRWRDIVEKINKRNRPDSIRGNDLLEELRRMGQNLCDKFLPPDIREKLITTSAESLILEIDSQLVHIPWELIHINGEFLCQRFNMGRLPSTYQKMVPFERRILEKPFEMWILADPGGNLPDASQEGEMICEYMDQMNIEDPLVYADFDTEIGPEDVREKIKEYDFVHFAGHADYDSQHPGQSGWRLTHGNFTARDVRDITGGKAMPAFVFSNACQSARTEKWEGSGEMAENETFGLANAFMLAGVRHYLGTSWEVKDKPSSRFAHLFYEHLFSGKTMGEAVRQARLNLSEDKTDTSWAGYLLYGDPRISYFSGNGQAENWIKLQVTTTGSKLVDSDVRPEKGPGISDARAKTSESGSDANLSEKQKSASGQIRRRTFFQIIIGLAVIAIGCFIHNIPPPRSPSPETVKDFQERNAEKKRRIDRLWKELQEITDSPPSDSLTDDDDWTSPPLTLAFVFESQITFSGQKKEELIAHAIQIGVNESSLVKLLHRKSFDVILEELIRANAPSVDPKHRLRPRLKMPAYLVFVAMNASETPPLVLMELVRTQTRHSIAFPYETLEDDTSVLSQKQRLSQKLLTALRKELGQNPIRGRISKVSGKDILLNIGEDQGVRTGQQFKVVDKDIILEVESVRWNGTSTVSLKHGDDAPAEGWRVESEG